MTAPLALALSGRYRVERPLGQGGMATVYLAADLQHDRKVAIKVLRPELAAAIGAERFLAEIRTTANLQHPHILPLFDSGQANGLLFYVMPFVNGESLRDRLTREKQLPIGDALRIATEVGAALDYAHRQGIIHRDIKPENILLQEGSALVADFGIALAASRVGGARLTETGVSIGTPQYMSPEQAMGERDLTLRSDVYALGALTYEMLTGEPPFTGPTLQSIIARVVTERPAPIAPRRDTVPPNVERAILTALEKVPADRFGSAAAFSAALANSGIATPPRGRRVERSLTEAGFRLSEDTCRRLTRASFDPRLIGTELRYLDNGVPSDVLVCYFPACGRGADQYTSVLESATYRAVAVTPRGFESQAVWRPSLPLDDHIVLVREYLRDLVARWQPKFTIIAGFSSGGDFAIRFAAAPDPEGRLRVDGCLVLGANLSFDTCFLTQTLATLQRDDEQALLAALRRVADGAGSLDEWLNVCEYVTKIVPTFRRDVAPLRAFADGIAEPFRQETGVMPFAAWFRQAAARGVRLRCVFEDTPMYRGLVRDLQLRNLDDHILGPQYEEQSVVTEAGTTHFDLIEPSRIERHVQELVARLRGSPETRDPP